MLRCAMTIREYSDSQRPAASTTSLLETGLSAGFLLPDSLAESNPLESYDPHACFLAPQGRDHENRCAITICGYSDPQRPAASTNSCTKPASVSVSL